MNPFNSFISSPNYWLSCVLIDEDALCEMQRSEHGALYKSEPGKSCPTEILERLNACNAEGRPIWKPMHLQPIYRNNAFITENGSGRGNSNAYITEKKYFDVGTDIFNRGLCLPSDIKMTDKEQDKVIGIIKNCFK